MRVCSVKDLLMNVGDQFSKDEVSKLFTFLLYSVSGAPSGFTTGTHEMFSQLLTEN